MLVFVKFLNNTVYGLTVGLEPYDGFAFYRIITRAKRKTTDYARE